MTNEPAALGGLLGAAPRFLFFTGKGGVGKTFIASATAIALADTGCRVLLVSTDPASNLDEVLGVSLGAQPRPVPGVQRLDAANIDPLAAAAAYRERVVGPYRNLLPDSAVHSIEEQLSGACTVEIAAFDEFTTLLADPLATADYDHVLFDTAPTGHTLRLLSLPGAWTEFMDTSTLGVSCIGPLAGLSNQRESYRRALTTLADRAQTLVVLVTRADALAVTEAARAADELRELGIMNQRLAINGVLEAGDTEDEFANAISARHRAVIAELPASLANLERDVIALLGWTPAGADGLRALASGVRPEGSSSAAVPIGDTTTLGALVDDLASTRRGLVMTMGKGGVGKTTIAAAVAVELARRGHRVRLSTTDPAAHLDAVLGSNAVAALDTLTLDRIDPVEVTRDYTETVLATAGATLDEGARAVLAEDLRSPCTEEIAVFQAFAETVAAATDQFVVLDTAPTGHTLLLLDAARTYHREVQRQGGATTPAVDALLARLGDPDFTRVLVVTVPEATPVHEAAALQEDLRRAGIEPAAWVVNQCLFATSVSDPVLVARANNETRIVRDVVCDLAATTVVVAMLADAPTGLAGVDHLVGATGALA